MPDKTAAVRKITRGFQVTLPRSFRERYGLQIGDVVEMVERNGVLSVQPVELRRKHLQTALEDVFQQADEGDASVSVTSEEEAMALAEQEIKRQYLSKSLYGAEVATTVTPIERNRARILIKLASTWEGIRAAEELLGALGADEDEGEAVGKLLEAVLDRDAGHGFSVELRPCEPLDEHARPAHRCTEGGSWP